MEFNVNKLFNVKKSSNYRGVHKHQGKWRVQVSLENKTQHLGVFNSELEAAKAYDDFAIKQWGEFAQLNFPTEKSLFLACCEYAKVLIEQYKQKLAPNCTANSVVPVCGGGGAQSSPGFNQTIAPEQLGQTTPNLFSAAQKYMPSEYFGNSPIYNPTSILNAYTQNLPAFLQATRSQNVTPQISPTLQSQLGQLVNQQVQQDIAQQQVQKPINRNPLRVGNQQFNNI